MLTVRNATFARRQTRRAIVPRSARNGPIIEEIVTSSPITSVLPSRIVEPGTRKRRRRRRTQPTARSQNLVGLRKGNMLQTYLSTLRDPFMCGPVRLGWGSFTPTGLHTAFLKKTISFPSTVTAFALVINPQYYVAPAAVGNNGFYKLIFDPASSTALSAATVFTNVSATNSAYLSSVIQTARVVSAAVRCTVRYAATQVRGSMAGIYVPDDSATNMAAMTFDGLLGLNGARWAHSDAAGSIGCQVNYRPVDTTSFEFYNAGGTGNTTNATPALVVAGGGWPLNQGCAIEVEVIIHYETLSGLDAPGDDADSGENTLAASGSTMDQAGAVASRSQPVVPNISAMEMLDAGLQNAFNSGSRTGVGRGVGRLRTALNPSFNTENTVDPEGQGTVMQPVQFGSASSPPIFVDRPFPLRGGVGPAGYQSR